MTRRYLVLGLSTVLALSLAVPALGGPGNPVASTAVSAAQALKKAKKAKQAATAAQATADTALSRADNAQVVAVNAENRAITADNKATAAQTAAAAAQASANAANANANTRLLDTTTVNGTPTANNGDADKSASAPCPTGDIVTGGGYEIGGTDNRDEAVVLESTYGDSWFVGAGEIDGTTPGNWSLTARAICGSN